MVALRASVLLGLALLPLGNCSKVPPSSVASSEEASYTLVSREHGLRRRVVQNDTSSHLISFDGNLDAIHELALAQASRGNVRESFSCDELETVHLEIIHWKYSIETVPTAVIPTVYGEVQEITLEHVAPNLLVCLNESAAYANIVALDTAIPGDEESTDECEPILDSANVCTNVIGRMRLFLSEKESVDTATALVLQNIKAAFRDPTFITSVGAGLLRISFVDEDTSSSETPINDEPKAIPGSNSAIERDNEGLSLSSALVMSFSAFALIFFVGSVYVWRRGRTDDDQDGAATRLANSSSFNGTTTFDNSRRPTSPYSEMVSSSYRLDRLGEMSIMSNNNMSPVYEQDQEDTDTAAGSIVLSEGGYTTDAGATEGGDSTYFDGGSKFSGSQSEPMYLGARPFPGTVNMNLEDISDSDLDTSGEMSPVKMYVGPALLTLDRDDESSSARDDESMLFSPAKAATVEDGGNGTVMSDVLSMSPQYEAASP